MPRKATGSVEYIDGTNGERGHYCVRISCPDGSRPRIHLPPGPKSKKARARALERAAAYSERARREGIVAVPKRRTEASKERHDASERETAAAWWERFFEMKERRGDSAWKDDRGRCRNHILPVIDVHMAAITRDDCEELRDTLDDKIHDGELAWKTAWNVWSVWTTACKAACSSKRRGLRVRDDNPCAGVEAPDRGHERSKTWLWPVEFIELVECAEVPLVWRRRYTLAIYLYLRGGELRALDRADINLAHGIALVHRAMDRSQRGTKDTKTGIKRRFKVEPALMPLLRAIYAESGDTGRLIEMPDRKYWSTTLRAHLKLAGVDRAELFIDDQTRKHMTFHDLKATAVTWMGIRGDEPLKIMQRAAHKDFKTTQGYLRAAEMVGNAIGEPFPELPRGLLGSADLPSELPKRSALRIVSG